MIQLHRAHVGKSFHLVDSTGANQKGANHSKLAHLLHGQGPLPEHK